MIPGELSLSRPADRRPTRRVGRSARGPGTRNSMIGGAAWPQPQGGSTTRRSLSGVKGIASGEA
eukprot:225569-Rhodomonas_salina.4